VWLWMSTAAWKPWGPLTPARGTARFRIVACGVLVDVAFVRLALFSGDGTVPVITVLDARNQAPAESSSEDEPLAATIGSARSHKSRKSRKSDGTALSGAPAKSLLRSRHGRASDTPEVPSAYKSRSDRGALSPIRTLSNATADFAHPLKGVSLS
jgi:hypothetical protein